MANKDLDIDGFIKRNKETIRVGPNYQADIPELLSRSKNRRKQNQKSVLVWLPSKKISDDEINDYIFLSKIKDGYETEQALGMLFWYDYDIQESIESLSKYLHSSNWTILDKNNFEYAYKKFGKNFSKIQKILPDKSLKSIICHYYLRKKKKIAWYDIVVKELNTSEPVCGKNLKDGIIAKSSSTMFTINNEDSEDTRTLCPFCGATFISYQTQDTMCEICFINFSKINERNRPNLYLPCPNNFHLKFAHLSPRDMLDNQNYYNQCISNGQGETILSETDNEIQSKNQVIMTRSSYKKLTVDKTDYKIREPFRNCIFPYCSNDKYLREIQDKFKGKLTIVGKHFL